jgi:hypothetical protein
MSALHACFLDAQAHKKITSMVLSPAAQLENACVTSVEQAFDTDNY